MKEKRNESRISRRQFLKESAALGAAAAAAAVTGNAVASEEGEPRAEPQRRGYRHTAHVDAYYRSARV
ncbi:MAG: hypothetical protein Kow006_08270 [Gammaproteobacteria bacterium]